MAKISEMAKEEIEKYIQVYQDKVNNNNDVETSQKKLDALKAGLKRLTPEGAAPVVKNSKSVKTFHSSDVDYSTFENATFGQRSLAFFIDSIIVTIGVTVVNAGVAYAVKSFAPSAAILLLILPLVFNILGAFLYAYFLLREGGQTVGKKVMKIKIIYTDSKDELSGKTIFIREVVGKWISGMVLCLGYIFVLLGKESWHDSFAKTKVINLK